MSISSEISRLTTSKNTIKTKMLEFGLGADSDKIDDLAAKIENIVYRGVPAEEITSDNSYEILPGYYGGGTISAKDGDTHTFRSVASQFVVNDVYNGTQQFDGTIYRCQINGPLNINDWVVQEEEDPDTGDVSRRATVTIPEVENAVSVIVYSPVSYNWGAGDFGGNSSIRVKINGGGPEYQNFGDGTSGWIYTDGQAYITPDTFSAEDEEGRELLSLEILEINFNAECLSGDTKILCANNIEKCFSDVKEGDLVASINPHTMELEYVAVTRVGYPMINKNTQTYMFDNGVTISAYGRHRFWKKETNSMEYLQDFNIGDHTIDYNGNFVALVSKDVLDDKQDRNGYYLHNKYHNYFANGLMSGDRATKVMDFKIKG